ncbi:MAG: hypothetical protein WKF48_05760 [Solirubrobacteraceae bacterium]
MSSFLEELRAADEDLRHRTKPLVLDVPGRGGKYAIRYRPPEDRDVLTPVLARISNGGALDESEELQLIVDCCDEVLVRENPPRGEAVQPEGGPLRFDAGDERWGDTKTARGCVSWLFAANQFPLSPARHVGSLIDWLQGLQAESAARLEGKSEAAGA